jgi:hypothetical protein
MRRPSAAGDRMPAVRVMRREDHLPEPAMSRSARRRTAATFALLAAAACSPSSSSSPSTEPASDADLLPLALVVRSDTPYITGTIVRRDDDRASVRVRVRAPDGTSVSAARVPEAVVTVHPDSLLVFRDGRAAAPAELIVGRTVVVWVRGPELRSLPPQVTGSAVLVERR